MPSVPIAKAVGPLVFELPSVAAAIEGATNEPIGCHLLTEGGGLARIKDGIVSVYQHNDRLPSLVDVALLQSRDGSLWLGTLNGLSRIQGDKLTVYSGDGHFSKNFTSVIFEDDEGLIVTNAESRAFRFKDGKALPYTARGKTTPITDGGVYTFTIYRDPAGTLWFGTNNGLFKLPAGGGPGGGWQLKNVFDVTTIYDDGRGHLWLGGRTPGMVRFRIADKQVIHYMKREGLFDRFASHIEGGDDGNLWISTEDGLYAVSQKDLDDFADGRTKSVSSTRYGLPDGMNTTEASNTATQPGGCRTPDGKLWFTTRKGIVVVDPMHRIRNDLIPPVMLETVVADGVTRPFSGELAIPPGMKAIEFHYTALSFRVPERVRFKYQLEGYDHEWVDAGSRRVAYYTNLSPGKYRFRVIACNDDGVWNEQGASVNILLEPRFYQTQLFFFACLLLAILMALGASWLNTRRIRNRAALLKRLVDKRTEELRKSQRELEQLALFDTLTALPNRRMFAKDFGRMYAQPEGAGFSLLLVDVDNFKTVNDTFGHDAGDAFLVEASNRLGAALRSSDRVARLGGDEFAILLGGDYEEASIERICERILQSFSAAVDFKGASIQTGVSIGIASFPEHGDSQENLYKAADLALYEAKRRGRNNWCWYRPELEDQLPCECA